MYKTTINEATQKRILQLAGLSDFEEEVLAESKKGAKASSLKENVLPSVKKKETVLDEAEEPELEEEPESEEEPSSDITDVDTAPASPGPEVSAGGPPSDPNVPHTEASEGSNFVDVDFDSFAAGLASLLKKNFSGVNFAMQVNGQEVSEEPELDESEFGEEPPVEDSEPSLDSTPEFSPEPEPKLESKKVKNDTVKLVYEAIIKNLVQKSGVKVDKNKKAEVKFTPKKK